MQFIDFAGSPRCISLVQFASRVSGLGAVRSVPVFRLPCSTFESVDQNAQHSNNRYGCKNRVEGKVGGWQHRIRIMKLKAGTQPRVPS